MFVVVEKLERGQQEHFFIETASDKDVNAEGDKCKGDRAKKPNENGFGGFIYLYPLAEGNERRVAANADPFITTTDDGVEFCIATRAAIIWWDVRK